jgi:Protein of unknown function (DUF1579)
VADNNNHLAGRLPAEPHPAVRQLDRLVGAWDVSGPFLNGSISFEWMEGGFFLIQHVDARTPDQDVKGIEYIGFDEDTETLRSHYIDTRGSNFAYTWEVDGGHDPHLVRGQRLEQLLRGTLQRRRQLVLRTLAVARRRLRSDVETHLTHRMRARRRRRRGWDERTATSRQRRAVKVGCGSTFRQRSLL